MNINWKNIYLTILRDGGHPVLKTVQYSYNIGPTSVRRLQFTNEEIKFLASFDGRVEEVIIKDIEADFSLENEDLIYALSRCRALNETETSRAYNGIKTMLDKIADYMYSTAIKDGRDGNGSFILSAAKNFHSIRASYKEVYKDLQEEQKSRIRGGAGLAYDQ